LIDWLYGAVKALHVITAVFMAAPLYNLIVVNERARFGKALIYVDRYFERIIRGNSTRCYVFQLTALVSGLLLVALSALSFSPLLENWRLLGKSLLLLVLLGLLTVVHIKIQPRIDILLSQVTEDSIPAEIAKQVGSLRLRRKRLAASCLFVLLTILILAVQLFAAFSTALTVVLVVLAALLSWRVYKVGVPHGWV